MHANQYFHQLGGNVKVNFYRSTEHPGLSRVCFSPGSAG